MNLNTSKIELGGLASVPKGFKKVSRDTLLRHNPMASSKSDAELWLVKMPPNVRHSLMLWVCIYVLYSVLMMIVFCLLR